MDDLHDVRRWLRSVIKWEDERDSTWYSQGLMLTKYTGLNHPIRIWLSIPIRIWLSTPPSKFPKELQSANCKVVKLPSRNIDDYAYVCTEKSENGELP